MPFLALALLILLVPPDAEAMCNCMMRPIIPTPRPIDQQTALPSKATIAVMLREDTRTVLSFQNDYFGPVEDFALLVPVPTILEREDVRTLDHGVFDRVQQLAAPKLIEAWEQPPCMQEFADLGFGMRARSGASSEARNDSAAPSSAPPRPAVVVERQFAQGEYDIQILSASDALGLQTWLRANGHEVPPDADPILASYVAQGMHWFVAQVNIQRFERMQAQRVSTTPASSPGGRMLSPLRFHYDHENFGLPVRLGLVNSAGLQDLVVHIIAPDVRYEVANYTTVTVPTNVSLRDEASAHFGRVYDAYFDKLRARHPRRVFTEYAGPISGLSSSATCVGCERNRLSDADLDALGDDVLPGGNDGGRLERMVLTRLHYRYARSQLPDDLVFRPAGPIAGGHEHAVAPRLRHRPRSADRNGFGVRFLITHPWEGAVQCANPRRGVWGGRPRDGVVAQAPAPLRDAAQVPLRRWIQGRVPGLQGRTLRD